MKKEEFCNGKMYPLMTTICEHYNPKMNFFEAWAKAEDGDKLKFNKFDNYSWVTKNSNECGSIDTVLCWCDSCRPVSQLVLFEKEWTIIPKKKTVTVDMPEDATSLNVQYVSNRGHRTIKNMGNMVEKITYEIDGDETPE